MMRAKTIEGRLIVLLALLGTLLLASVVLGQLALSSSNDSLRSAYEDRVVPLSRFLAMREAYDRIVDASREMREQAAEPHEAAGRIEAGLANLNQQWDAYLATKRTPEQKRHAADMQAQNDRNAAIVAGILERLRAGKLDGCSAVHLGLNQMMALTVAALSKLTDLQLRATRAEYENAREAASRARLILIAFLAAAALALLFGLHTVLIRVIRPLDLTTALMGRLAAGDLTATVTGGERRDEVGAKIRSVQIFKDAMLAKQAADEAAAFETEAKTRRAAVLDQVTKHFEDNVSALTRSLAGAAGDMEGSARTMTNLADQATQQAVTVPGAAEQTSGNMQTAASATEEMAASVQEIVEQVTRSAQIAG